MSEKKEIFNSRWGGSVFDCSFCGSEGMQWKEISPGKWMPFDLLNDEVHDCPNRNINLLSRSEVLHHLQNIGFEAYTPRTTSWKYAFTACNNTNTIYFLVGKYSIDFKFYDFKKEIMLDERGRIFTDGGQLVRNYYTGSEANVHELVLEIASKFVSNTPIETDNFSGHGKTRQEQKAEYIKSLPKSPQVSAREDLIEIYDGISCGDGEDAYLGDGVWISSKGSIKDNGR